MKDLIQTVRVEVSRPLIGDELLRETELLQDRREKRLLVDERQEQLDALIAERDAPPTEPKEPEDDPKLDAKIEKAQERLKDAQKELRRIERLQKKRAKERRIVLTVQVATFAGRMRQVQAAADAQRWARRKRLENAGLDPDDPELPLNADLKAALTSPQAEAWATMSAAATIIGAVARDDEGEPLVENFEWPQRIQDWVNVPNYIVEPVLSQSYACNPDWTPDWLASDVVVETADGPKN